MLAKFLHRGKQLNVRPCGRDQCDQMARLCLQYLAILGIKIIYPIAQKVFQSKFRILYNTFTQELMS